MIQILNTRETQVDINYFRPEVHLLSDYKICNFERNCNIDSDRVRILLNLMNFDHLNSEETSSIQNICAKISDVFHLSNDKLSTTNLYDQSRYTAKARCRPSFY